MSDHLLLGTQCCLSATKCEDGHSGLIRIRGWTGVVRSGKTVAFTVLDEDDLRGWTRLIGGWSSTAEPLEVGILRSSIGHRIKVTAKVLKSRLIGPVDGVEYLEVEHLEVTFESSCTATEELVDVDADQLSHLLSGMSVSAAESNDISSRRPSVDFCIEQVATPNKARVTIENLWLRPTHWLISIRTNPYINHCSCIEHVFVLQRQGFESKQDFDFPISFAFARTYQVIVQGLDVVGKFSTFVDNNEFRIIAGGSVDFKAGLTKTELNTLLMKAVQHAGQNNNARCDYLYRNKPQPYFDDIFQNHGSRMEVYIKDNSGDPGSPINGQIKGLFFMAGVEPGSTTGQPTRVSAFGGTRLLIPAKTLLEMAPNLYFADFYCMRGTLHYVTLVLTRYGSEVDMYCTRRLPRLSLWDRSENPFLFYDENGQLQVSTRYRLHVEVLFTEDLDIYPYRKDLQQNTPLIGKGETTPGGLPKNISCSVCNSSPASYTRLLFKGDF